MIYLACFLLSALFAFFAAKAQSRWKTIVFSFLSIILPVLLAGLRDISVGIDTSNYYDMERYWATASVVDSVKEYMAFYLPKGYGEVLFALLVGVMGQIGNFHLFLFVVHGWIITCVYIGAFRLRKYIQPWLVLLLFYLAFYSHSLNVMRQYMALSIVFVFMADLLEKKYLRYCIGVVLATMFHTSGFLTIGLLVIHVIINGDFRRVLPRFDPSMRKRKLFIFVIVAAVVLLFNPVVRLLVSEEILHKKYMFYVKSPFKGYNLLMTLCLLAEMIPLMLLRKNLKRRTPVFDFFFTTSVVYLILYQITAFVTYGKRIAACCSFANLVTLALLSQGLDEEIAFVTPRWLGGKKITLFKFPQRFDEKNRRILATVLVIGAVTFYWAYVYVLRNSSETIPYRFFFQ